eukprot:comp11391_c0_seq1/m.5758 comp11391_c0_seq1/g.5758  ORF comp11391_c0_seq1/g.5758 comp11391_c0_seq1/m.5758 type:complete len:328 (-) comp11391_c0_seq1:571-1554(-)
MVFSLNQATAAALLACLSLVSAQQTPSSSDTARIQVGPLSLGPLPIIKPISPLPGPVPPVPKPVTNDEDDDGISDKCGEKLKSMCDPTADAMVYDTCIAAKVCEADGFCTYQELLQFSNKVCSLVAVNVQKKCGLMCSLARPMASQGILGGPSSFTCNSCRSEAFRSGGCASAKTVDAVVLRYLNKLNDGTCKAENAAASSNDVDADNDGLTDDCEKIVEATCDPTKEANNYDECLSANACAFAKACTPKELTTFAINYCKLRDTSLRSGVCKVFCQAGSNGKTPVACGRCALKDLLAAGCEYENLLSMNLKTVDAVYNKLQMGECD